MMRMRARALVVAGLTSGLAFANLSGASAAQIASESFDYAYGQTLNGQNGGTGWAGAWVDTGVATETIVNPVPPLSYQVPGGGLVSGGDHALRHTGNDTNSAYRSIAPFSGPDLYVSFLIRFDGGVGTNDFAALWLDNAAGGDHSLRPNIGIKANEGPSDQDFVVRLYLGGEEYAAMQLALGETYMMVGHLWRSSGANHYDHFDMWVNPTLADANSPDAEATDNASTSNDINSVSMIGLRSANLDSNDVVHLDELRIGTTWNDVVPAPEPATMALLGAGLLGLCGLRRRR